MSGTELMENVEADMSADERRARADAFSYFDEQQKQLQTWQKSQWKPQDRRVIARTNRAYRRELERIKDERSGNSDRILTEKTRISLYNGKINNHTICFAGSGRGKTYSVVGPNILQANSSYVFTDPKGDLSREYGTFLVEEGFEVKILNFIDMLSSNSYNCFRYLRKGHDEDVMTLIETIMNNTDGDKKSNDPFWEKGEQLFTQSVFYWMLYELREDEQSIPKALEIMRMAEVKEENEGHISDYDAIMLRLGYELYDIFDGTDEEWDALVERAEYGDDEAERLVAHYKKEKKKQEEYRDNHIAYIQYKHFKAGAGKTAKSIIISACARLSPFNIPALRDISLYDELELDKIGERKTALFIVMPPTEKTFQFISGMCLTQLFSQLNYCANVKYATQGAKLPVPVQFILDEFKNTGRVPMFVEILAYARSMGVSIMPILQSLNQLQEMYEKEWETILDNCASLLFLGGIKSKSTLEYIQWLVNKGTFDKRSFSESRGMNPSASTQDDKVGVDLITVNKLQEFPEYQCLLFVSGYKVVWDKTFDLSKHPNFKRCARGGNIPYIPNSEEIKHKQEMFKLYLRQLNNEDEELSPRMEFLGKSLEKAFTLYERVWYSIKKDANTVELASVDFFKNAIAMENFNMYSNIEVEQDVPNEVVREVTAEREQIEQALSEISIHKKALEFKVLDMASTIKLTQNAIRDENATFLSASERLESFAENFWRENEGSESDGDSSDSSDKEENDSHSQLEEERSTPKQSNDIVSKIITEESSHGEEILEQQEVIAEETTKKALLQIEEEQRKTDLYMQERLHEVSIEQIEDAPITEFSLNSVEDIEGIDNMDSILAGVDEEIFTEQGDFMASDIDLG